MHPLYPHVDGYTSKHPTGVTVALADRRLNCRNGELNKMRRRHVRQHDSVSVWIFECLANPVPVWVRALDRLKTARHHLGYGRGIALGIRKVEDQEVVLSWRSSDIVASLPCKLEMVTARSMAEHNSVKPLVVLEPADDFEAKAIAVKREQCVNVVCRPRDADMCHTNSHDHRLKSSRRTGLSKFEKD